MRLAIVGSRDYPWMGKVEEFVLKLPQEVVIVSGAARGVDSEAAKHGRFYGHEVEEWPADWDAHGKAAGAIRNEAMIQTVDRVVAFWDCESRGTRHALQMAGKYGKPFRVCGPDGEEIEPEHVQRALGVKP